jgi:hypothetical protein
MVSLTLVPLKSSLPSEPAHSPNLNMALEDLQPTAAFPSILADRFVKVAVFQDHLEVTR